MADAHNQDTGQAVIALLWPVVQEWLKNSNLPIFSWINHVTPKMNVFVSAAVALATTLGVHFMWTPNPEGGGALLMVLPPAAVLAHAAGQLVIQHLTYKAAVKGPATQDKMLAELQAISAALTVAGGSKA